MKYVDILQSVGEEEHFYTGVTDDLKAKTLEAQFRGRDAYCQISSLAPQELCRICR